MQIPNDPLGPYPALRYLRDDLLIRDPAAIAAGEALVTRILYAATLNLRIPPDRLISTEDAARLLGMEVEDFDQLAYSRNVRPVHILAKQTYWRVRDVYELGN
jgi:hypothetical protein